VVSIEQRAETDPDPTSIGSSSTASPTSFPDASRSRAFPSIYRTPSVPGLNRIIDWLLQYIHWTMPTWINRLGLRLRLVSRSSLSCLRVDTMPQWGPNKTPAGVFGYALQSGSSRIGMVVDSVVLELNQKSLRSRGAKTLPSYEQPSRHHRWHCIGIHCQVFGEWCSSLALGFESQGGCLSF